MVPARLGIKLGSSVTAQTKVGDEFDVIATLTNNEDLEISNIKSQPLEQMPSDIVELVSGPTTATGTDPRVDPITLAPKAVTTISWRYRAAQKGAASLRALVSGKDPHTESLFFVSDAKRIAIEAAALDITSFRMRPGSPVPGTFGNLHGVVPARRHGLDQRLPELGDGQEVRHPVHGGAQARWGPAGHRPARRHHPRLRGHRRAAHGPGRRLPLRPLRHGQDHLRRSGYQMTSLAAVRPASNLWACLALVLLGACSGGSGKAADASVEN
jgi:hypothetical protein